MAQNYDKKKTVSWAFYDWANSAFATTVIAGFFPVFFKQYWSPDTDVTLSTFRLGAANSFASLIIVALAPILGAIADRAGAKKKFLLFFAMMGIVMTGSLYFVAKGDWILAVLLYALGIIGFSGGNIFYDSLLISVSNSRKVDFVSAFGFAMGYLGGGILFAVNVAMTLRPEFFGLSGQSEAIRLSFVLVAIWWAVFSIPLFLFVKEPVTRDKSTGWHAVVSGFRQLRMTFVEIRRLRIVFLFLLGYWLYIDGVDTIVRMAVDYGLSLGFDAKKLIVALLITQFVGFPSAIAFGKIGEKFGPKTGILIGICVYIVVTIWAFFMKHEIEFYALAVSIGLVQGGVQSLSRSFFTRIIPINKSAEFFGFYNMLGKFAAVIGPILMGWIGVVFGDPRIGLLSIIVLFVSGAILLSFVNEQEGSRMAKALEKI
ncbi:MAG: MFS transporter [Thermodesulfovibrionia bacterium]|nr:MFS transporter [Thermodesulfovibrionia bacterium]